MEGAFSGLGLTCRWIGFIHNRTGSVYRRGGMAEGVAYAHACKKRAD